MQAIDGQPTPDEVVSADFPIEEGVSAFDGRARVTVTGQVSATVALYADEADAARAISALRSATQACVAKGYATLPGYSGSTQIGECGIRSGSLPRIAIDKAYSVTGSVAGNLIRGCGVFLYAGRRVAQVGIAWEGLGAENQFTNQFAPLVSAAESQQRLLDDRAAYEADVELAGTTPWDALGAWLQQAPAAPAVAAALGDPRDLTERCAVYAGSADTMAFVATSGEADRPRAEIRLIASLQPDGRWLVDRLKADIASAGEVDYTRSETLPFPGKDELDMFESGCAGAAKASEVEASADGGVLCTPGVEIEKDPAITAQNVRVIGDIDCETALRAIQATLSDGSNCTSGSYGSNRRCTARVDGEAWTCKHTGKIRKKYPYSYAASRCLALADRPSSAVTYVEAVRNLGG